MDFLEILVVSFGLAMDAFAVSICKGLSMERFNFKKCIIIALYFGVFQAGMPIIGYLFGGSFSSIVESIGYWIAFLVLIVIGVNMIKESFDDETEKRNEKVDFKTMTLLATATSIDALAVGITYAFLSVSIIESAIIVGMVTFILSICGVKIGNKFGDEYQNKAELLGGIILIFIGTKILLEHLEIIP